MTDVFVEASVEKTYNLERAKLRTDAKQNPEMRFHAHASVAVINRETGLTEAVIKPGMVAMAVGRPVEIGETKADFLKNMETDVKLYYVLEIVSKHEEFKRADEADAEALVILVKQASQVFGDDISDGDRGYYFAGKSQWVDVDKFIGIADMVLEDANWHEDEIPAKYGILVGCLAKSDENMSFKNREAKEDDLVYLEDKEHTIWLEPDEETLCFWSRDYLNCSKLFGAKSGKKRKNLLKIDGEEKESKKNKKKRVSAKDLLAKETKAMKQAQSESEKLEAQFKAAKVNMQEKKARYIELQQQFAALNEN